MCVLPRNFGHLRKIMTSGEICQISNSSGVAYQVQALRLKKSFFIWPPFFQYNKRLLRQKTVGACLYMPQDGHWLASFEVIPPPQKS